MSRVMQMASGAASLRDLGDNYLQSPSARKSGTTRLDVGVFYGWEGEGPKGQWPSVVPDHFPNVTFHFHGYRRLDYAFVLNDVRAPILIKCDPQRIWGFIQEPPVDLHKTLHLGRPYFARVYTTDESLREQRYVPFWSALKWAVGLTYDELRSAPFPEKTTDLAWVTSNLRQLKGHMKRMDFLDLLRAVVPDLKLYGRGFAPVDRKWDVLAPARYSIAFENFSNGIYWSEKLADCFLSFSTPIYFGARDIDRYFPPRSYLSFDPDRPGEVDRIRELVASDFHEQNRTALIEARELCLTKYNTLFYLGELAQQHFLTEGPAASSKWLRLTPARPIPLWRRGIEALRRTTVKKLPAKLTDAIRSVKHKVARH